MDVKDADGKVTRWMVEGGSPNALFRRGVTKDALPQGTEILVDGYQAKDGSNRANGTGHYFRRRQETVRGRIESGRAAGRK